MQKQKRRPITGRLLSGHWRSGVFRISDTRSGASSAIFDLNSPLAGATGFEPVFTESKSVVLSHCTMPPRKGKPPPRNIRKATGAMESAIENNSVAFSAPPKNKRYG